MKRIPLTKGKFALVDDEDYERVLLAGLWSATESHGNWYARRSTPRLAGGQRGMMRLHRFIMNAPDEMEVDHIDGNGLNNVRSNLRICTQAQNVMNKRLYRNNSTGFKGVRYEKRYGGAFYAKIRLENKDVYLGQFKTAIEAAQAYDEAALKYFGEFARLNRDIIKS